jgi:hypothetical protein
MKECRKPVAFADPKSLPYDVREHLLSDDARKPMTAFWQTISAPHMPIEVAFAQNVLCGAAPGRRSGWARWAKPRDPVEAAQQRARLTPIGVGSATIDVD